MVPTVAGAGAVVITGLASGRTTAAIVVGEAVGARDAVAEMSPIIDGAVLRRHGHAGDGNANTSLTGRLTKGIAEE